MKTKNPLAFPRPQFNPQGVGYEDAGIGNEAEDGITLRDYFAGQALQGMLCNGFMPNQVGASPDETYKYEQAAYELADAMLKARSK